MKYTSKEMNGSMVYFPEVLSGGEYHPLCGDREIDMEAAAGFCGASSLGWVVFLSIRSFYFFASQWYGTISWNPSSCKTRTYLFHIANIMGADVLATQGARAFSYTAIWRCRKPISQWQCSFHLNAALSLVKSSKTGPRASATVIFTILNRV